MAHVVCGECKEGKLERMQVSCMDCGKDLGIFYLKTEKPKHCRCEPCRKEIIRIRNEKYKMHISEKVKPVKEKRQLDCKFYLSECLTKMVNDKKYTCKACDKYRKQELNIEDYMRCGSSFAVTNFGADPMRNY